MPHPAREALFQRYVETYAEEARTSFGWRGKEFSLRDRDNERLAAINARNAFFQGIKGPISEEIIREKTELFIRIALGNMSMSQDKRLTTPVNLTLPQLIERIKTPPKGLSRWFKSQVSMPLLGIGVLVGLVGMAFFALVLAHIILLSTFGAIAVFFASMAVFSLSSMNIKIHKDERAYFDQHTQIYNHTINMWNSERIDAQLEHDVLGEQSASIQTPQPPEQGHKKLLNHVIPTTEVPQPSNENQPPSYTT